MRSAQGELSCGILGGLGPEATIHFLHLILQKTKDIYGAEKDQDHVRTIVEINPHVPNRNQALVGAGDDCGGALQQMASNLVAAGADFVVCACNTAHAWQEDIQNGCGPRVPFVSMVEVSSDAVAKGARGRNSVGRCGILAGGGCIRAGLFQRSLAKRGVQPVCPSEANQDLLQDLIYRIKAGNKASVVDDLITVLKELKEEKECSHLILGCTELPLVIEPCLERYTALRRSDVVDATDVMVEVLVRLCKCDLELKDFVCAQDVALEPC